METPSWSKSSGSSTGQTEGVRYSLSSPSSNWHVTWTTTVRCSHLGLRILKELGKKDKDNWHYISRSRVVSLMKAVWSVHNDGSCTEALAGLTCDCSRLCFLPSGLLDSGLFSKAGSCSFQGFCKIPINLCLRWLKRIPVTYNPKSQLKHSHSFL